MSFALMAEIKRLGQVTDALQKQVEALSRRIAELESVEPPPTFIIEPAKRRGRPPKAAQ